MTNWNGHQSLVPPPKQGQHWATDAGNTQDRCIWSGWALIRLAKQQTDNKEPGNRSLHGIGHPGDSRWRILIILKLHKQGEHRPYR